MSNAVKFVPLLNRVLVEKIVAPVKSAGGILLPTMAKTGVTDAIVVSVGPGMYNNDGVIVPPVVKPGDHVYLPDFGGSEIKFDNKPFYLFRETDILGYVAKE